MKCGCLRTSPEVEMLSTPARFYFWGVHGIFGEVLFTATWEYVVHRGLQLKGFSSLWSFLNYGLGTLLVEALHEFLVALKFPLIIRLVIYVLLLYLWEFTAGLLLLQFKACPWDYSQFDYNFMGLITLEYFPFWLIAASYFELIYLYMKQIGDMPLQRKPVIYYHYSHCLLRRMGLTPYSGLSKED